ncbi:MAG: hypothetical protein HC882_02675 [Acidobacteria bacterium]|nr:hypothetical protein [Acidobacteriota bacterium]
MSGATSRAITVETRALVQSAKLAVRDVFDAIVELVTNADDRYQRLRRPGVIEIEVERRRGAGRSVLRVRDHADGMDAETMERKLSTIGGRESGLAEGEAVRGTHSRGAKDVAALGRVIFESIAGDGRYHRCEISEFFEFTLHETEDVTPEIRERLGLRTGTGTVVTIELDKTQSVPQHDNLKLDIARLVSLRGILADPERKVFLKDGTHGRATEVKAPLIQGTERVKETFEVPGHPGVSAKLVIGRAKKPFEKDRQRFRAGGIQIRSKRAIHEATLFDSALESDPHALWFYGRLTCDHIDVLCNAFDDRFAQKLPPHPDNPTYPLDPSRRSGLNREHPFVKALFRAALIRLRPLVEEERTREENERSRIESDKTRKRLLALEKAALDFMRDFGEEDEPSRDPEGGHAESNFQERGFGIWPPFARLVVGQSQNFTLTVLQKAFPEIQLGDTVQIECHTEDIAVSRKYCGLDSHPTREAILRAVWTVKGVAVTPASGIRVRVGPIVAESVVESCRTKRRGMPMSRPFSSAMTATGCARTRSGRG